MDEMTLSQWEDFPAALSDIHRVIRAGGEGSPDRSDVLFRGQADSRWRLRTTLERAAPSRHSTKDYFRVVGQVQKQLETFTGLSWQFDLRDAFKWTEELPHTPPPGYELLVYLRHHGFPSPLLDWTASAQIAAFFAFREAIADAHHVSIYAFAERIDGMHSSSSDEPSILGCGPNVRSHPRHFLQQAQYTLCTEFAGDSPRLQYFSEHQSAVVGPNLKRRQDWMWKINIPSRERIKVLRELANYNLTAFSLFASTDSLAETLGAYYLGGVRLPRT